ncbi:MAG: hypothetical protein JST26_19600 [Bacteroidetes bacterium]|nr:hypothetical protein [Bacteroidota bacterium]
MTRFYLTGLLCLSATALTLAQEPVYKKENTKQIIVHALEMSSDKNYADAISELKRVDRNDSNYVIAAVELANIYITTHKDTLAIDLCDNLLKQKNDYTPTVLLLKASALGNLKRTTESQAIFDYGIKEYPLNNLFYYEQGMVNFRQKKYEEANALFIKSIRINPLHASSHLQMANLAILQGKIVPSMMALQFYLVCDNTSKRAVKMIDVLESLSKIEINTDSLITLSELSGDNDFAELESIVKSKAAFSDKYKSKTDMEYNVVKQMQLICENIGKYPEVKGFYNTFYGKFFTDVWSQKYFAPYVYYSFSGTDNEQVQKIVTKNKKQIDAFENWAYDYICTKYASYNESLNGQVSVVPHWGNNGKIVAAGGKNDKGEPDGYWNFYYENGIMKSQGPFSHDKKNGDWTFYFKTGDIKEQISYDNGLETKYKDYYYNNNPKSDFAMKNGLVEGNLNVYYTNGQKQVVFEYKNNKKAGQETRYHRNGAKRYTIQNNDGKISGELVEYYDNGKINEKATFINDKREGKGQTFYNNEKNSLYAEGEYKGNYAVGAWKTYHENGKIATEGSYNNDGLKDGVWKTYYDTGILSSEESFADGKLDATNKYYNEDGSLWQEFLYKRGKLQEFKSLKNNGEVIAANKVNGKNFSVVLYYSNGRKQKEGLVTDGDLDGIWKEYNVFGAIQNETTYTKGKQNGKYTSYHLNGKIASEINYTDDQQNGYYRAYYLNGKVSKEGWMVEGQAQGYWKYYHINGAVRSVEYYYNGNIDGWAEYHDELGKLSSEDFYQLGCLTQVVSYDSLGHVFKNTRLPGGNGILEYKFSNGQVRFHREYVNDYASGKSLSYYPDGKVMSDRPYANGKINGKQMEYDPFGRVISETPYFNDMINGKKTEYFENGQKESEYTYVNDDREGACFTYFPNGKLSREINYQNDELHGESKVYDESGELAYQRNYHQGVLVSYTYKDASGNLLPLKKIEPGETKVTCFYQNGKKSLEATYFNGDLHGKRVIYNANGKKQLEDSFEYGSSNGAETEYYYSGNIKSTTNYEYGYLQGASKEYYENGKLKKESFYVNGNLHGPVKYYDESGKLIKTIMYYNDIPLSIQ